MMVPTNPRNEETTYSVIQYASGPWQGKWVVRMTESKDVAAVLTKGEAESLKAVLERAR